MSKASKYAEWSDFGVEAPEAWVSSRYTKRKYVVQGYKYMISLYGALKDLKTGEVDGKRIEVLSKGEFTKQSVEHIYNYFHEYGDVPHYSIWIYDYLSDSIKAVWEE